MRKEISGVMFVFALNLLVMAFLVPGEVFDTLDGKLPLITILTYLKGIMTGLLIGVSVVLVRKCV